MIDFRHSVYVSCLRGRAPEIGSSGVKRFRRAKIAFSKKKIPADAAGFLRERAGETPEFGPPDSPPAA
ncbi:MAG: hypothetical protein KDM63_20995 [Verrucomicrobiae bacterium]|nr:hypothetical protein [Verrucomicrobiae bacterium]